MVVIYYIVYKNNTIQNDAKRKNEIFKNMAQQLKDMCDNLSNMLYTRLSKKVIKNDYVIKSTMLLCIDMVYTEYKNNMNPKVQNCVRPKRLREEDGENDAEHDTEDDEASVQME